MFTPVIEMLMAGWGFCVSLAASIVQQAVKLISAAALQITQALVAEVSKKLAEFYAAAI